MRFIITLFKKSILSWVLFLLLYSCQKAQLKKENLIINSNKFSKTFTVKSTIIPLPFYTYSPFRLTVSDSLLFFADNRDDNQLLAIVPIEYPNESIKIIKNGTGPEELTSIGSINIIGDSIVVLLDAQTQRYLRLNFKTTNNLQGSAITSKIPTDSKRNPLVRTAIFNDSLMISYCMGVDSLRFSVRNQYFQPKGISFAPYPEIIQIEPVLLKFKHQVLVLGNLFEPKFRVDEVKGELFVVNSNANMVEVYDLTNYKLKKTFLGPKGNYPIEYRYNKSYTAIPCEDCVLGYYDIGFSDEYIFGLWSGKEYSDRDAHGCEIVHILTRQGEELYELKLDRMVSNIVYDKVDNRLYMLSPFYQDPLTFIDMEFLIESI